MQNPIYEIYVRDRNLNRIGVIQNYSKLEMNLNYNAVGGWIINMADGTNDAELMKAVAADYQNGGYSGVVVVKDGIMIFSGPIQRIEATGEFLGEFDSRNISFGGMDDTGYLMMRQCYSRKHTANPSPPPEFLPNEYDTWYIAPSNTPAVPNPGWGYDIFPDAGLEPAEDVILHYVNVNAGEDAANGTGGAQGVVDRRIRHLYLGNNPGGRGIATSNTTRYDNLLETVQQLATVGELGFRIIYGEREVDGNYFSILDFQIYEPEDKSSTVIFSRGFGTLGGYRYKTESPKTNYVVVGGQGQDENRTFMHRGDNFTLAPAPSTIPQYGMWENFIDRRDTEKVDELLQSMDYELIENTKTIELEVKALNVEPTRYGIDYQLGDKVSVFIDGQHYSDIVRSVNITLTKEDGEVITPIIATSGISTSRFRLFEEIKGISRRVSNLEKNY